MLSSSLAMTVLQKLYSVWGATSEIGHYVAWKERNTTEVTITKHSLPESPQEGLEMRNKQWQERTVQFPVSILYKSIAGRCGPLRGGGGMGIRGWDGWRRADLSQFDPFHRGLYCEGWLLCLWHLTDTIFAAIDMSIIIQCLRRNVRNRPLCRMKRAKYDWSYNHEA